MGYLGSGECLHDTSSWGYKAVCKANTTFSFLVSLSIFLLFAYTIIEQRRKFIQPSNCLPLSPLWIGTSLCSRLTGLTGCHTGPVVPRSSLCRPPWTVKTTWRTMRGQHCYLMTGMYVAVKLALQSFTLSVRNIMPWKMHGLDWNTAE